MILGDVTGRACRAQIMRELGMNRGTVAKYARQEDCAPRPKKDKRYDRKTDAFGHVIDQ